MFASLNCFLTGGAAPVVATDPYYEYVSLLLSGDGTNGAQNNTFLDSSTNNFTITRNGNTTQGTFSPYGNLWSNYFDGSGDYLTLSNNITLAGNFTIEAWVFNLKTASKGQIIASNTTSPNIQFFIDSSRYLGVYDGASTFISTSTVPSNSWSHVAVTRLGSTITFWINGQSSGTNTTAATFVLRQIGVLAGINDPWLGYISNLRVVTGTAVYSGNFTPSTTPLTAVSGTSLLTCQSNRFIDNSSNNFTLTVSGTPSVQRFSPFNPTAPYSASTIGGSGYFDGTGDYLYAGQNAAFAFGTGNFTVEFFVYTSSASAQMVFDTIQPNISGGGANRFFVYINSDQTVISGPATNTQTSTNKIVLGSWNHVAVVRSGTTRTIYINGVSGGSATLSNDLTSNYATIGFDAAASGSIILNGYLSNLRVVKGTAVYTTAFTPPTAPVTAISGTSLLCNFTNAGIPDAAMMNDLETVGNAQVSTSVKKYGTGSLYFDGTGDYLQWQPLQNTTFGTGNFTIEMWVYPAVSMSDKYLIDNRNASQTATWAFGDGLGGVVGKLEWFNNSSVIVSSSTSISTGTWSHVAYVRNGSTGTIYINGVSTATGTDNTNYNITSTSAVIGARYAGGYYFNGYIDDLRITKGYARYTSNFTPPTAAFPTY